MNKTVQDFMSSLNPKWTIESDTSLSSALKLMGQEGISRILVMKNHDLLGLIAQKRIFRYAELKQTLLPSPSR